MSPKRVASKSSTQKQLDQLPLLKKPLEQIGKQIKVPGKMAEMNVAETQVDVVASAWKNAEAGYDELSGGLSAACKNATELLVVREAQEANDAAIAASLQGGRGVSDQWRWRCACNRRSGARTIESRIHVFVSKHDYSPLDVFMSMNSHVGG
jgi:Xaa-Pro aminopeptidase